MKYANSFHFLSFLTLVFFFVIGFMVTGILNIKLTSQKQTVSSKAAGPIQESACASRGGECQTGKLNSINKPCNLSGGAPGIVKYNYCPLQEGDIRCCVSNSQLNPNNTYSSLTVTLQGIGPNAKIIDQERTATIKIFDNTKSFDTATFTASDTLKYDSASGKFVNPKFNFGLIPDGDYQMVIQIDTYLDEQLSNPEGKIFKVNAASALNVSPVQMKAGDLAPGPKGDNHVNIIDYNAIIGCMNGAPTGACLNKKYADLNNDGVVDKKDLDLLLLNFGDNGFAFQTDQFSCEPDPACNSRKESLQLCTLLCTRKTQRS